ncbi:hypothetical protein BD779DRAFT_1666375 [Infundibulicybe gibba]|nr:hypothetical protein BD779DRAFT_1666375 [Infundibulicybe gibba]
MSTNQPVQPPYYILFSHSSLSNTNAGAASNTLGHPVIQYHYADDSPLSLVPQHPNEHLVILEYDPREATPIARSISKDFVVADLKVEEAPGAAAAEENDLKNSSMFIIETILNTDGAADVSQGERASARSILSQFKRRNSTLQRAILYPNLIFREAAISQPSSPPVAFTTEL